MEIRDNRAKEWFWLDNEYLNGYARFLNPNATAVYISLCRHAKNDTQKCFPSMKLIAEENNISTKTVERSVKLLEEWKIIFVERSRKPDGKKSNNIYTLTAKSMWLPKPTDRKSYGNQQTENEEPTDSNDENQQTDVLYNYTNINNTNITNSVSNETPFVLEDKLKDMEKKAGSHLDIIATFIREKKLQPQNSKELTALIKRHGKIASTLTAYPIEKIFTAMDTCVEESKRLGYEWSLETVWKKLTQ